MVQSPDSFVTCKKDKSLNKTQKFGHSFKSIFDIAKTKRLEL